MAHDYFDFDYTPFDYQTGNIGYRYARDASMKNKWILELLYDARKYAGTITASWLKGKGD